MSSTGLGALADELYARDPARLLTVMFADATHRGGLVALYHFNSEVARVRHVVSEPMIGEIRLQWWREALDEIYAGGPVRKHPTVEALRDAITHFSLPRPPFDALIDARASDIYDEPFDDVDAYLEATSSGLMGLAHRICGGDGAVEPYGSLAGRLALLTAIPVLRAHGPYPWGGILEEGAADFMMAGLEKALADCRGLTLPRQGRAAILPLALAKAEARRALKSANPLEAQPPAPSYRQQLSLLRANLTGRI